MYADVLGDRPPYADLSPAQATERRVMMNILLHPRTSAAKYSFLPRGTRDILSEAAMRGLQGSIGPSFRRLPPLDRFSKPADVLQLALEVDVMRQFQMFNETGRLDVVGVI